MEAKDFDHALYDLEKRLDRLRALYEQYFRGYERCEPLIPRKDLERRLYGLRKELPRNTAVRFRYNQLKQRYVTLTTRWGRVTRQIEEGTHPMVLERLRRRRRQNPERAVERPERDEGDSQPPSYELSLEEGANVDELLSEQEMNRVADAIDRPGPHRATLPPGPASQAGLGLGAMGDAGAPDDDEDNAKTGRHAPIRLSDNDQQQAASGPRGSDSAGQTARGNFARPSPSNQNVRQAPSSPQRSFARPAGGQGAPRPAPSAPQASGRRVAPGAGSATLEESRKRAIYDEFVRARRANNESAAVRYETVAKRIDTMLPELRKKHGTGDIDFDVVVRNGRVGLRPKRR